MDIPLLENGSSIVNMGFLCLENPSPPSNAEVSNDDADIIGVIDEVVAEFAKLTAQKIDDRPGTDGRMAEFLHHELKLTLYQAAQRKFWHYIAVVKCPQYVAWRWFSANRKSVTKTRYTGPWYLNAFGRLWWWAEYTQDPAAAKNQYVRTVRAGISQEFMRNTIENSLCGNRALVRSLCDAAFPVSGLQMKDEQHRDLVKRVNAMLVTTALDALQPGEIDKVVKSLVKEMNISEAQAATQNRPRKKGFFNRLAGRK